MCRAGLSQLFKPEEFLVASHLHATPKLSLSVKSSLLMATLLNGAKCHPEMRVETNPNTALIGLDWINITLLLKRS